MVSAYAYFLSMYPETADGISLMRGFWNIDTSNIPVTHDELQALRLRLSLELPHPEKKDVQLFAGNPDLLFVQNIFKNFPTWKDEVLVNQKKYLQAFEGKYPDYLITIRKVLGKEKDKELTLGNAIFYLDVYYQGLANSLTPTKDVMNP